MLLTTLVVSLVKTQKSVHDTGYSHTNSDVTNLISI